MKRTFALIAAACMLVCAVALAACGGGKTEPETYTVTYAANGGEGTMSEVESYKAGETVTTKPADTFTKEGYTFKAWSDGEKEIAAGATFTMPAKNVTLTAQGEEIVPQLCGVWTGTTKDEGYDTQFELVITEGDEDFDIFFIYVALRSDGMGAGVFYGANESEDKKGEYIPAYMVVMGGDPTFKIQWSESEKTLQYLDLPADEEISMTYHPLPAAQKIEDGTYVLKEGYEGEGLTAQKIVVEGTKWTQYTADGEVDGEYEVIAVAGDYFALLPPGGGKLIGFVAIKTEDGLSIGPGSGNMYPHYVKSAE